MGDESQKFMTMQETMEYLGVSRATIDTYARAGKLKRFKQLKNTVFLREQVEKLKEPKPKP
jgi:predicted site-specific integrase-resolvase